MSGTRIILRPKADQDLDDQAYYYATNASPEIAHRFLLSADETLALLAVQVQMGWKPKLSRPELEGVRVFRVNGFERILILYRPIDTGIEVLRFIHGSRNIYALLRREGL